MNETMVQFVDAMKLTSRRHCLLLISSPFLLMTIVCCSILSELYGSLELGCAFMFTLFHSITNVNKTYMFLLFNVILAIVAKTFNASAPPTSRFEDSKLPNEDGGNAVLTINFAIKIGESTASPAPDTEGFGSSNDRKPVPESSTIRSCEREQGKSQQESRVFTVVRDEEEETKENKFLIEGPSNVGFTSEESLDEANKKFEEFIMKMREKLRFEAQQQQLIMA